MYKQKAKIKQNKILKVSRGITLIALVITIIVLLILAAVSIATLTGENGILSQADKAGEETKVKGEEEQIELSYNAVMSANKGTGVTEGQLEDELQKYNNGATVTPKGKNFEIKFSNGNIYTIIKDGTIQNGSVATPEEVNAKMGQVVDYQESETLSDKIKQQIGEWRIFYASDDEMFLISSNTILSSDAFGGTSGIPLRKKGADKDYTGAKDVFETNYGATYNKLWKETGSEDEMSRSQATAYLCDKDNWEEYVGENAPAGTYAVGGPTKELFILSWNASIQQTYVKEVSLADEDVTKEGYVFKENFLFDDNPILQTILPKTEKGEDGLYNNGNAYWLASPSYTRRDYMGYVYGAYMSWDVFTMTKIGVRPLVSIPMSKVKIENGIVTIESN